MATHGQIGEFNSQREDRMSYSKRLEECFIANDIKTADKKKAILLSVVGANTYQLIQSLVAPEKPKEKIFEQLVKLVQEHHQPTPPTIVQHYKFNSQTQSTGESVATFVAKLRHLAEHCQFGQVLDEMLRLIGMRNRRWSCSTPVAHRTKINSQESFGTSPSSRDSRKEGRNSCSSNAHKLHSYTQSAMARLSGKSIARWTHAKNSNRENSIHATVVGELILSPLADIKIQYATSATRRATLLKVCRSKKPTQNQGSRTTHQIAADDDWVSDTSEAYELFNLQKTRTKPLVVTVKLNNSTLDMELDTGASLSIINEKTFNSCGPLRQGQS